jgi:leucyl aminopeptidase
MKITLLRQSITSVSSHWLCVGLFDDDKETLEDFAASGLEETLQRLIKDKDLTASLAELTSFYNMPKLKAANLLVVGLGPKAKFDGAAAYTAGYAIAKRLSTKSRESVAIVAPRVEDAGLIASVIEGAVAGTRGPGLRKTEPDRHAFGTLSLVVPPEHALGNGKALEKTLLPRAGVVGHAINLARDLVNTPPAEKSPIKLAERIKLVAEDAGVEVELWDEARIRHERFGGLLAVAAGSDEPPVFMVLKHHKGGDKPRLAYVGKGVTFDSGGLCLKPPGSMEDMKCDMTGAAVVAASIIALARLNCPVNVTGYLAITENMTGGKAMKMGDVLTMRNSKTVEVLNTDAEGRLILADAMSYAAETQPYRMIDLATLTGACMVALGGKIAGMFANNQDFADEFSAACRQTGERVWRMPLDDDFKDLLKSTVADFKNIGGKYGGAITAAKFLEQFVGSVPWIHLDIAGPSWAESDSSTRDAGGTGCFVRTLVTLAERVAAEG